MEDQMVYQTTVDTWMMLKIMLELKIHKHLDRANKCT